MVATAPVEDVHNILSAAVDVDFYGVAYPDVARAGLNPVDHYTQAGWREGRDPAPWFSTAAYLADHPDVAAMDINPLRHFLLTGRHQGRDVMPSALSASYFQTGRRATQGWRFVTRLAPPEEEPELLASVIEAERRDADRATIAAEFDAMYYLGANPDVADLGLDPLDHFINRGWRENRDPTPTFSIRDYLDNYADIAQAEVNPFVHYIRTGRAEGRIARNELGFRYDILKALQPIEARLRQVRDAAAALALGSDAELAAALASSRTGFRDLHLTFSHDDFAVNSGGLQLCLQRESAQLALLGRDHLHVYPAKPWPVVRKLGELGQLGLVLNGTNLGAYAPHTIAAVLSGIGGGGERSFAIHSLLGHCAEETAEIIEATGQTAGYFWLHDFASLCAGYHLLRNDVEDCGAPPAGSAACGICIYGPWRERHMAEHRRLFERLSLTVVSPSVPTLDLWRDRGNLPAAATVVLPHATLIDRGAAPLAKAARPLRIAYAGMPAPHKGWPLFRELVLRYADDPRYEFLHLGGATPGGLPLEFHRVVVTDDQPRAMQDAIEQTEADLVLIWPLCRETFSFVAYEAVAGGAAILTWPDSGNVAAFVEGEAPGRVLADEAELDAALRDGELAVLSRKARKARLSDLSFSRLTVDLLEARP